MDGDLSVRCYKPIFARGFYELEGVEGLGEFSFQDRWWHLGSENEG